MLYNLEFLLILFIYFYIAIPDSSGKSDETHSIPYDMIVYAVGAENNTFGIPGVAEHGNFLKEVWDAEKIRRRLIDCEYFVFRLCFS